MSWIARSIANSLKLDEDYQEDHSPINKKNVTKTESESDQNKSQFTADTPRGVKEDLSELTKSFSRQIWGVASFLSPQMRDQHQPSDESDQQSDQEVAEDAIIEGIRSDFSEIRGKFQRGISRWSNNISVSEITKMASNFLQFGLETEPVDAVGVTEDVLMFARTIAVHPETWLDFPVPDEEDFDDFDMSDVQQEHALAVVHLAPTLAALRMELCPEYMSENCFWKIYFVLLHPRLNKNDAELLSTPQIVEARAMLAHELQNRVKAKPEPINSEIATSDADKTVGSGTFLSETAKLPEKDCRAVPSVPSESMTLKAATVDADPSVVAIDSETEKQPHPVQSNENQVVDREEAVDPTKHHHSLSSSSVGVEEKFEDDGDDWLKEEISEMVGMSGSMMHLGKDEDVSFSDLEEEDGDVPVSYKKTMSGSDSSTKDSRYWVQLSRSSADSVRDINPAGVKPAASQQVSHLNLETKESNDWLDVDDIDEM